MYLEGALGRLVNPVVEIQVAAFAVRVGGGIFVVCGRALDQFVDEVRLQFVLFIVMTGELRGQFHRGLAGCPSFLVLCERHRLQFLGGDEHRDAMMPADDDAETADTFEADLFLEHLGDGLAWEEEVANPGWPG